MAKAEEHAGAPADVARTQVPERIGGRYAVQGVLGRGGMAVVYRVLDAVTGRELALKRLVPVGPERRVQEQVVAFEREYHTLVQLSHPRIISVYDFGADEGGRYYTMELLEGGDLRERAPLGWRDACAVAYDVCSSLALLHSRRLVHRDVSPRNVRRTGGGSAKLIDFGAMVPMSAGGQIVGTPPFVAPEVLHRSTLDGRSDLFSLGATLYFALTGRLAYAAREFARLHAVWAQRPPPPSAIVREIPPELDALVMSMISLDAAARPRSAFEVMQRLAAIAGLERAEDGDVSQAYLSTPVMVGRSAQLADLRRRIELAASGQGGAALIEGPSGAGRTRMLDACALEAKLAGAAVLRVNAGDEGGEALAAAQALAGQLAVALPELAIASARRLRVTAALFEDAEAIDAGAVAAEFRPVPKGLAGRSADPAIAAALTGILQEVSRAHPLAILIDDLHQLDEASLSLLAALVLSAASRRLFVVATAQTGAAVQARAAFAVFRRDCAAIDLAPLGREEIESLLGSVFGDVANLALVSERLYQAAAGNPGETLEIARALVARGLIRYEAGQWLLPRSLAPEELPTSAAEACKQRVTELSPLARRLAELHALASRPSLSGSDHAAVARDVSAAAVDAAIAELVAKNVLVGDGRAYALSRGEWSAALIAGLDRATLAERHLALAELYAGDPAFRVERVHHLLAGGREALALDLLIEMLLGSTTSYGLLDITAMNPARVAVILDRALTAAEALGRKPRELYELRRGLFAISILTDEAYYARAAPAVFAQLAHDSGLAEYRALADAADPNERLMRALTAVSQRFAATPEAERVLDPEEAIKGLAYYVAISIALGSRTQDYALLASLPLALEPFVALSPLLHAMWQNAIATREQVCDNHLEQSRERWLEVYAQLASVSSVEMSYVAALRAAVAYGITLAEARLGITTAEERARMLDDDPAQRASAMSLRRVARLHRGDFAGAERFRKRAELYALHGGVKQMFTSTVVAELIAHAMASDLAGIRESAQVIAQLAARFPGWVGYHHLAEGYFEQVRGRLDAARDAFARGLAAVESDPEDPQRCAGAWPRLEGAYLETLVGLGEASAARSRGVRALARCEARGICVAGFVIRRALALAEAKLGDCAGASARLEEVIRELVALDIRGLELGATYEARVRIAIWAGDRAATEHYGRLTAEEYRYGQNSPLGARYERLMDEARTAGVTALPELGDLLTSLTTSTWRSDPSPFALVRKRLDGLASARERAEAALELLCEARGVSSGQLFVSTPGGLELAASCGEPPDPALHGFAAGYVRKQFEADEHATVVDSGGIAAPACFRDGRGVEHQAALLMGDAGSGKVCAGAAVFPTGSNSGTAVTNSHQLLDAIGEYLLMRGDACDACAVLAGDPSGGELGPEVGAPRER